MLALESFTNFSNLLVSLLAVLSDRTQWRAEIEVYCSLLILLLLLIGLLLVVFREVQNLDFSLVLYSYRRVSNDSISDYDHHHHLILETGSLPPLFSAYLMPYLPFSKQSKNQYSS